MDDTEHALKVALIDAILSAYHTTRLSTTPAAEHILSKDGVQRAFAALRNKEAPRAGD